jgi:hypothetical protein
MARKQMKENVRFVSYKKTLFQIEMLRVCKVKQKMLIISNYEYRGFKNAKSEVRREILQSG